MGKCGKDCQQVNGKMGRKDIIGPNIFFSEGSLRDSLSRGGWRLERLGEGSSFEL